MALGAGALGDAGRYVWTPVLAGAAGVGHFRLATTAAPPAAALGAALLVAGSPPMLFQATQTMSDLPVAALWVWVLVWLQSAGMAGHARRRGTRRDGAGRATESLPRRGRGLGSRRCWPTALRCRAASPARRFGPCPWRLSAAAVAAINARLWGSPLVSGYGPPATSSPPPTSSPTSAAMWRWTVETRGYWTAAGLAAVVVLAVRREGRVWWPAGALVAGVLASYLPYAQFAEWWYLRFYLPVWPVVAAACATVVWQLASRWSPAGGRVAIAAAALVIACHGASLAQAYGVFDLWRGEQRYRDVGRWVDGHAGANAALLAVQHSGALNYYTRRAIVRFDEMAADDLDRLCEALAAAGRDVWLVVDDWEEPLIRARFASQRRGRLDWAPIAEARVGTARGCTSTIWRRRPGRPGRRSCRWRSAACGHGRATAPRPRSKIAAVSSSARTTGIVAGASLVFGAAAWASRAVLDEVVRRRRRASGWRWCPTGTSSSSSRCSALLAAGGLHRALSRRRAAAPASTLDVADLMLPVFGLALLLVPFLPGLPDRWPAVQVLGRAGEVDRLGDGRRPVPVGGGAARADAAPLARRAGA